MNTARERAVSWLTGRQVPDGSIPSRPTVVEASYKVPWALQRAGRPAAAAAALDAVARLIDDAGDVSAPREDEEFNRTHYLYANGYLTIGALVLGRFDISRRLFAFVRGRQRPVGGFTSQGPSRPEPTSLDTVSTCISGLAALYAGDLPTALAAGRFVEHVWRRQPHRDRVFYPVTTPDGELLTEPFDDGPFVTVRVTEPEQDWYFIGIAIVFLPYLYAATGERRHLELGCSMLDYLDADCNPDAFTDPSSGKSAVGGALLHRLTGNARYREIAQEIAQGLILRQCPSGAWRENPAEDDGPEDPVWSDLDMTAEYVLWLSLIEQQLGLPTTGETARL